MVLLTGGWFVVGIRGCGGFLGWDLGGKRNLGKSASLTWDCLLDGCMSSWVTGDDWSSI